MRDIATIVLARERDTISSVVDTRYRFLKGCAACDYAKDASARCDQLPIVA